MLLGAIGVMAVAAAPSAQADTLNGAGGTAIYPLLSKWAETYSKATGTNINYQAIGSGGGIKQIESKTVPFANTDKPLTPEDLDKNDLIQFPQVIISIVPVVNLKGVNSGDLVLDGPTMAGIFLGYIKYWDDAAITRINPKISLPHTAISVVHRSDGSGTTFNFTDYLSKLSPEWKQKVGEETAVEWPVGVGGKGNAGVAAYVQQLDGAIGYVEYAYAVANKLVWTDMINKSGVRVKPTLAAFQAAAGNADFSKVKNFYLVLTDQPGAASWPITAATYMLLRKDSDPESNMMALKFLDWALRKGQDQATALDYVPMPDNVVGMIEDSWKKDLLGKDGKPIWQM
jgi:phosphate transport system substrate-binding protein